MGGIIKKIAGSAIGRAVGIAIGGPFGAVIGVVVSLGLSAALAPKPNNDELAPLASAKQRGLLLNVSNSVEPVPVIYGTRKVGGSRVFAETTGDSNEFLHVIIVWGEGTIDAIQNIYIDDVLSGDARFSGLLDIHNHLGDDLQVADVDLVSRVTNWTIDHRLSGLAYTYIRLEWDQDKFGGFPTITADIDGKKILDTRTETIALSHNPAMVLYFFHNSC